MENYVLLYHFEDNKAENAFRKKVEDEFWRHQTEENQDFKYLGFAGRAEPEVVDKLNGMMHHIDYTTKDYVALYHSREEEPDKIKRQMLLGHDELVENKVEDGDFSFDAHRNSLTKLLNFDYVKAQPEPPKK
ncbi:hypothetical protein [Nafulsella turpanensis]|uniref:hypothetical protein n=1 Tax=Nafulsella turpanensis TaxID=1265690 RepID=UPI00034552F1|nr:hypothetical protein [Nafulsella turpanensis]